MAELTELGQALANLKKESVEALMESRLKEGAPPLDIVKELNDGMTEVGTRFAAGDYFLSELMYSGHIMKELMDRLKPLLGGKAASDESADIIVIGTVKGDIHDLGKNIVVMLLQGAGFGVIDLGVDVPAEIFVEKIRETGAKALGLSCLLNLAFDEMKKVVDLLTTNGLRNQVKVIIGGEPTDEEVRKYTGADYWAPEAATGVKICKQIYSQT